MSGAGGQAAEKGGDEGSDCSINLFLLGVAEAAETLDDHDVSRNRYHKTV